MRVRRTLQIGAEHLTDKQSSRLDAQLTLGDPDHEVTLAWQCYQRLRNINHARPERGRELVTEVISSFPTCPIPEVARLGRTLKQWKAAILAYSDTQGASHGPTEAINVRLKRPPAELPAPSGTFPTTDSDAYSPPEATAPTGRNRPTMPKCEGPY